MMKSMLLRFDCYQAPRDMLLVVYLGLPLSLKCHFGPSLPAEKEEKLACKMSDITEHGRKKYCQAKFCTS